MMIIYLLVGKLFKNGVYNFPNIPTEEIFTSPNKDDVEGIVLVLYL